MIPGDFPITFGGEVTWPPPAGLQRGWDSRLLPLQHGASAERHAMLQTCRWDLGVALVFGPPKGDFWGWQKGARYDFYGRSARMCMFPFFPIFKKPLTDQFFITSFGSSKNQFYPSLFLLWSLFFAVTTVGVVWELGWFFTQGSYGHGIGWYRTVGWGLKKLYGNGMYQIIWYHNDGMFKPHLVPYNYWTIMGCYNVDFLPIIFRSLSGWSKQLPPIIRRLSFQVPNHLPILQAVSPGQPLRWSLLACPWESSLDGAGLVPSGKLTKNYGKSPFSMGKSTINGHFQ